MFQVEGNPLAEIQQDVGTYRMEQPLSLPKIAPKVIEYPVYEARFDPKNVKEPVKKEILDPKTFVKDPRVFDFNGYPVVYKTKQICKGRTPDVFVTPQPAERSDYMHNPDPRLNENHAVLDLQQWCIVASNSTSLCSTIKLEQTTSPSSTV